VIQLRQHCASSGPESVDEIEALPHCALHMLQGIEGQLLAYCSFAGPLENMPFNGNIIHVLAVYAVIFSSGNIANKAGMLFSEHPACPRTSMLKPMLQSVINTLRMIDNLTDISTIRIISLQVCF
jgi:hypothetical protein